MRWIVLVLLVILLPLLACSPVTVTSVATVEPSPTVLPPQGTKQLEHDLFSFTYPASWNDRADKYPGYVPHDPTLDADEVAYVSRTGGIFIVSLRDMPADGDLEEIMDVTYAGVKEMFPEFKVLSQGEREAAGQPAYEITYERFHGEPLIERQDIWLAYRDKIIILSCTTTKGGMDKVRAEFDAIIASFELK